ncbi:MAG TPA: hypothetical protein VN579_00785 [Bryobacteraceae bacterium]|nr:hypothetical protein [Bryobacteraceae bacterium]
MPRNITTDQLAALQASNLLPALFVTATFRTGAIYVWTGFGSITWGGHTWLGVGTLGSVSVIEEGATVEAKGITLTLSGIDTDLLADVLNEFYLGAPAAVYLGLFSEGRTLIGDPIPAWAGAMDQATIDVAGESAVIAINCESRLLDMNIPVYRRYTNEDQQLDYPGDKGLEFVSAIQETTIYWGRVPNSQNNI